MDWGYYRKLFLFLFSFALSLLDYNLPIVIFCKTINLLPFVLEAGLSKYTQYCMHLYFHNYCLASVSTMPVIHYQLRL